MARKHFISVNQPLKAFMIEVANTNNYKRNPMANAILGAFLYATNLVEIGKAYVESWDEVTHRDILKANGYMGSEKTSANRRRQIVPTFYSFDGIKIKSLGSTGEKLNGMNPQIEAVSFLRSHEVMDFERYSPKNISIEDMKILVNIFVSDRGFERVF